MLAFSNTDRIISAQRYYGTLQGLRIAIKRKCPSMLMRDLLNSSVHAHVACFV
jgi:hypothetical protein